MVSSVVPTKGFLTQLLRVEALCGRMPGVCVDSGSMGRDEGEGGCILASDTKIPPTPSFLWFYGLLTGSRLSSGLQVEISGRSVAEILTGALGEKGSPAGRLLDRMTGLGGGGTCKFWGNFTPLGGPLRCKH